MTEIKKKTAEELQKLLAEKREEVRSFRFDIAGSKKKSSSTIGGAKKEIARILTELNERKNAAA